MGRQIGTQSTSERTHVSSRGGRGPGEEWNAGKYGNGRRSESNPVKFPGMNGRDEILVPSDEGNRVRKECRETPRGFILVQSQCLVEFLLHGAGL